MIGKERMIRSRSIGLQTEAKFVAACEAKGYSCEEGDKSTNIKKHIDYYVIRPNDTISVDVKGNNFRSCIWVEFLNIKGEKGWLFGGADYIAFDFTEISAFVVVKRSELQKKCEQIVTYKLTTREDALHKIYSREGRQDAISKLVFNDLIELKSFTLLQYANN